MRENLNDKKGRPVRLRGAPYLIEASVLRSILVRPCCRVVCVCVYVSKSSMAEAERCHQIVAKEIVACAVSIRPLKISQAAWNDTPGNYAAFIPKKSTGLHNLHVSVLAFFGHKVIKI